MKKENLIEDDAIDLIELIKSIYIKRKIIVRVTLASTFLGVLIALSTPNTFSSSTKFIPQLSSELKTSSSLSGLASLAGINLSSGSNSSEISPLIYPEIVKGIPFRLQLLKSIIDFEGRKISIRNFLLEKTNEISIIGSMKKYTIGLPGTIIKFFKADLNTQTQEELNIYRITEEDNKLFKNLDKIITLNVDEKQGIITLSSNDTNQLIPAQITKNAEAILQQSIIEYKSKSSKETLKFVKSQYDIKLNEFNKLQDEIALFRDQNLNINSSLYQNKLDRLISEANILQSVVQNLASQVEQSKLQLNKDTPVFTIIQPVSVPFEKSGPSRSLIVVVWTFLGLVLAIGYVLVKGPVIEIWKQINS